MFFLIFSDFFVSLVFATKSVQYQDIENRVIQLFADFRVEIVLTFLQQLAEHELKNKQKFRLVKMFSIYLQIKKYLFPSVFDNRQIPCLCLCS